MITVVLNDEPDNDEVVHQAMEEGVAAGTGRRGTESQSSAVELAVVGRSDADEIAGVPPQIATQLSAIPAAHS
jgi:hypothetical protein